MIVRWIFPRNAAGVLVRITGEGVGVAYAVDVFYLCVGIGSVGADEHLVGGSLHRRRLRQ